MTLGQMFTEARIEDAARAECAEHYDERHVNQIIPCAQALHEARWWAVAFGLAKWEATDEQ